MNEEFGKSYFVCMSERLSSVVLVKKSFKGKLQFGAEKCVSKLWPYKSKIYIEHEGKGSWFLFHSDHRNFLNPQFKF